MSNARFTKLEAELAEHHKSASRKRQFQNPSKTSRDGWEFRLIAIDPGGTSGVVVIEDDTNIVEANNLEGDEVLTWGREYRLLGRVYIEGLESRGFPVGDSTFQTAYRIGQLIEIFKTKWCPVTIIKPTAIRRHICGTANAKGKNVKQALKNRWGEPGRKASPGPTYGVTKHAWQALAVATYGVDAEKGQVL